MKVDSGGSYDGFEFFHEVLFAQLFHRKIYGYTGDLIALILHLLDLPTGLIQNDHAEAVDVAVFFCQRNKTIREYQSCLWQTQTHQGFCGIVSTRVDIPYRLTIDQNAFVI